jgi:hypothetical protein
MYQNCGDEQGPTSAIKPLSARKIPQFRFLISLYPSFFAVCPIE